VGVWAWELVAAMPEEPTVAEPMVALVVQMDVSLRARTAQLAA